MISFRGRHHQQEMILQCVQWYVAYSLSYRDLEELMQERGYAVDHSTVQRWARQVRQVSRRFLKVRLCKKSSGRIYEDMLLERDHTPGVDIPLTADEPGSGQPDVFDAVDMQQGLGARDLRRVVEVFNLGVYLTKAKY